MTVPVATRALFARGKRDLHVDLVDRGYPPGKQLGLYLYRRVGGCVDRAGRIYLNGGIVSLEALKREVSRLRKVNGAVWFHRENPGQDPPPEALAVLQAIVEARLPVRLLEKDFD